ncbi:MAG: hypothetical protein ACHQAX_00135 [Gammaproteobacteria bacterium]
MLNALIDYIFWAKMDLWTTHQAVSLFIGWDPNVQYFEHSKGYNDYKNLMMLIDAAKKVGHLRETNSPADFYKWAQRKNIKIPSKLCKAITTHSNQFIDWEKKCLEEMEKSNRKDEKIEQLESKLDNSFMLLEKNDPFYSSELNTAIALQGNMKKKFNKRYPTISEIAEIIKNDFASAKLKSGAAKRIATVVNPDKRKDGPVSELPIETWQTH